MKRIYFLTLFLFIWNFSFSQEIEYREYSYADFFQMIEEEQDTIFELSNAVIILDEESDSIFSFDNSNPFAQKPKVRKDSVVVNKELKLSNVFFGSTRGSYNGGFFENIIFKKDVTLFNSSVSILYNSDFHGFVRISISESFTEHLELLYQQIGIRVPGNMQFLSCNFFNGVNYRCNSEEITDIQFGLTSCNIWPTEDLWHSRFQYQNQYNFWITGNEFKGKGVVFIRPQKGKVLNIDKNNFGNTTVNLLLGESEISRLNISKNNFDNYVFGGFSDLKNSHFISWPQFDGKLIDDNRYGHYYFMMKNYGLDSIDGYIPHDERFHFEDVLHYVNRVRIENEEAYYSEKKLRSNFYNYFKASQNTDYANAVYVELKNLETERLRFLSRENLSFDTYFTFKINQFLKVFSAYGTKPSKAIIYSLYVILFFAFIYLFFPNSWDSHGRKRIMDRYTFFLKYMDRKAGIHEVYLEDKKEEMLEFEEFKNIVESKKKRVPKIFTATAIPLYKWAISSTQLSSRVLKRIDIIKGTWIDLPREKKIWKGVLIVGAFGIAIIYDLCIKVLNALMLSINTFTTLGFGEIPIKGLPRYLAIIQGFIGWFMLTIFSVSLISQLLN